MARPLRVEVPGGRYHLTARGNERRNIFRGTTDYEHFLKLLSELPQRFGTRLHAFVLMPNHFHLLLETPEANLSRTGQWLNLSYSVWFNRKYQRSGHLFQGRFGAVILEGDAELQEVGRYLHLNPVRVKALGLDKKRRAAGRIGLTPAPSKEVVAARLQTLREWEWSSYPAYAGYAPAPAWLCTEALGGLCGGRSVKERQSALRAYCQDAVREGLETPWERLLGGVVLGSPAFVEQLRQRVKGQEREQRGWREMQARRPSRVMITNTKPLTNTAPNRNCQLMPSVARPNARKAFSPIFVFFSGWRVKVHPSVAGDHSTSRTEC